MSRFNNLILLATLGVADAWMIAHPNLMGRAGIFIFKYSMIRDFPRALITVFITLGLCYAVAFYLGKNCSKKWAFWSLIGLTGLAVFLLIQLVIKFNTGTYAHTGASFRFGLMFLPLLMCFIFISVLLTIKKEGTHKDVLTGKTEEDVV